MSYRSRAANAAIAAIIASLAVAAVVCGALLLRPGSSAADAGHAGSSGASDSGSLDSGSLDSGTVSSEARAGERDEERFGGNGEVLDPDGIRVDADHPGVRGLDPELRAAVQAAAERAAAEGIELRLNSGWRSAAYQDELLAQAVSDYGSEAEARHWVDTPERSAHVRGEAVDIGGLEAALWVGQYGAEFGLCQIYANENWHFELAPIDADGFCPRAYDSAAARPE
ncbi:M15 family metallopeptidase [Leucobacter sp. PH1c]|uniref:M15 family metallopeptidase n=1 Tax=Leucobacter sp. PH1c TaxID=1397278 RepID=UPI0012FF4F59|nr:M15 family metallopeptidase [Leucobacter sp. PH1c]